MEDSGGSMSYVFISRDSPENKNHCVFVTLELIFVSTEGAAPLPQSPSCETRCETFTFTYRSVTSTISSPTQGEVS